MIWEGFKLCCQARSWQRLFVTTHEGGVGPETPCGGEGGDMMASCVRGVMASHAVPHQLVGDVYLSSVVALYRTQDI